MLSLRAKGVAISFAFNLTDFSTCSNRQYFCVLKVGTLKKCVFEQIGLKMHEIADVAAKIGTFKFWLQLHKSSTIEIIFRV